MQRKVRASSVRHMQHTGAHSVGKTHTHRLFYVHYVLHNAALHPIKIFNNQLAVLTKLTN